MDINLSVTSKLSFDELVRLYELGETDKSADFILSLLLSPHCVNANWLPSVLDWLEAKKIIDSNRRDELQENAITTTLETLGNVVRNLSDDIGPKLPGIYEKGKEMAKDFASETKILDMVGDLLGLGDKGKDKPKDASDVKGLLSKIINRK
jgi:hypothetical protein